MNDKEFNRSILAKLYEHAGKVFAEGVNVPEGSYTASELVRMDKKNAILKTAYFRKSPTFSVKVGSFEASFCATKVFDLVARFEKLAGVGKAKQRVFTYTDAANIREIASVTVLLDKSMADMANFCDQDKLSLHKEYSDVALDYRNKKIVATNGHIVNVRKLIVIEEKGEINEKFYPLVEYSEFAKLCKNAGKKGEAIKISLIEKNNKQFWVCGSSKVEAIDWPNYLNLFDCGIIKDNIVSLDNSEWESVAKWIKKNDKIEPTGRVYIHHEASSKYIRFIIQGKDYDINVEYTALCEKVPQESFALCFQRKNLLTACKSFHLDISHKYKWTFSVCKENVSLIMPYSFPSDCDLNFQWEITGEKENVFEYCGFNDNTQETCPEAKETESLNVCSTVEDKVPCKTVSVPQNELSVRKDNARESNKEIARTTKSNGKRFTLYAIGLNKGDTLQFVDGQTVTVCGEKKVAYEGKEYTLSGFTKAFILNPNKSGAYRGIMYFYRDGMRLDKYASAYFLNEKETDSLQEIVPAVTKHKTASFEAGRKLSSEEKNEVLTTLRDAYKENSVAYHIEETIYGTEKRVYEPSSEDYALSDITGRRLRYYITLSDGRVAHPSELFPNIQDKEIEGQMAKQLLLDKEADESISSAVSILSNLSTSSKWLVINILEKIQDIPHKTRDAGLGYNNAVSYDYNTGIFISDCYQAVNCVVQRMRKKEYISGEVVLATKKAIAKSFGMVDRLISRLRTLINKESQVEECDIQICETDSATGISTQIKRIPETTLILKRVIVVLINIVFVCDMERNLTVIRRMLVRFRVGGGCVSNVRALYFGTGNSFRRVQTAVHELANPPPAVCLLSANKCVIRRLRWRFVPQKCINGIRNNIMEIKGDNIQLAYYILAAQLAKRNAGRVALATIEEIYGEEASDKMFSFMQWPESKEWFGKSTCETGTMYYLNGDWANCSMAAIRTDMERKMSK